MNELDKLGLPPMPKSSYRCEECKQSFGGIKEYIDHLSLHQLVVDVPQPQLQPPRKKFLGIFGGKNKSEELNMARQDKSMGVPPTLPPLNFGQESQPNLKEMDMRLSMVEIGMKKIDDDMTTLQGSMRELMNMVSAIKSHQVLSTLPTETPKQEEKLKPTEKKVRVCFAIKEKVSGEFLMKLQESADCELESIELSS